MIGVGVSKAGIWCECTCFLYHHGTIVPRVKVRELPRASIDPLYGFSCSTRGPVVCCTKAGWKPAALSTLAASTCDGWGREYRWRLRRRPALAPLSSPRLSYSTNEWSRAVEAAQCTFCHQGIYLDFGNCKEGGCGWISS